jgi:hypothetical protein
VSAIVDAATVDTGRIDDRLAGTGHRETLTLPWPDSYSSTSESFQHKLHRINWVGDVPA